MAKWKIYNEDAVEWARNYKKAKFHALLTDAPYHLTSITKRFGKKGSAPAKYGEDGVFQRSSKGFMGTQWDGGDLAFRPETWAAFGEVLHPGAFGMAFSASRNWHRMAVAIEDAGFILHPTIFLWTYGQGFPKATRIDTQIDQIAGVKVKRGKANPAFAPRNVGYRTDEFANNGHDDAKKHDPITPLAKAFAGHRYGLQALKPAVEPIIVFQKPYEGKPIDNITQTGAGALNIDGGRIPLANDDEYTINTFDDGAKPWGNGAGHKYTSKPVRPLRKRTGDLPSNGIWGDGLHGSEAVGETTEGRWPANLILTEESAQRMDEQSGDRPAAMSPSSAKSEGRIFKGARGQGNLPMDSGGASRYFYVVQEQLDEADPAYYCAKVSPKERNAGLDDSFEEKPAYEYGSIKKSEGRTGTNTPNKNHHPTVKPINLAKYLATLLLPPIEYAPRRIFIPFSGSGSEMIGCGLAGWEHVVGVEFDTENNYVEIAEKRLDYWLQKD